MEKNSIWKNNVFLSFLATLGNVLIVATAITVAYIFYNVWHWVLLPEKIWLGILTAVFTPLCNFIVTKIKEKHLLNVTFLVAEGSKIFEKKPINLTDKSFSNGICKINCEVTITGKTKPQKLLIKLDEGVDINFNTSNKPKEKRVEFAQTFENNAEKGIVFNIPSSDKSDREMAYPFEVYLELDSEQVTIEKIFSLRMLEQGWTQKFFSQIEYNSVTAKVHGED